MVSIKSPCDSTVTLRSRMQQQYLKILEYYCTFPFKKFGSQISKSTRWLTQGNLAHLPIPFPKGTKIYQFT